MKLDRYLPLHPGKTLIGTDTKCDLILIKAQSDNQCTLYPNDSQLIIDMDSCEQVYINGAACNEICISLHAFDFFSMNGALFYFDGSNILFDSSLVIPREEVETYSYEVSSSALHYPDFLRSSRIYQKADQTSIEVLPPKKKDDLQVEGLLPVLFPTIGMAVAMLIARGGTGNRSFLLYGCLIAATTVIGVFISRRYRKKAYEEKEERRKEKYLEYLSIKIDEIVSKQQEETHLRHRIHRPIEDSLNALQKFDQGLYDRSPEDPDFLDIRLGTGTVDAFTAIQSSTQEYVQTDDVLLDLPHKIQEKYAKLHQAPVVLPLRESNAVGVIGSIERQQQMLRNMVLDLALRHSDRILKLFFVFSPEDAEVFSWVRWLPHCNIDSAQRRSIICDEESAKLNLDMLFTVLSKREEQGPNKWQEHIILFVMDHSYLFHHPIAKYIEHSAELGVNFVFFSENAELIPHGCSSFIELDRDEACATLLSCSSEHRPARFIYRSIENETAIFAALRLAPVKVYESTDNNAIAKNITMYQLLGIRDATSLPIEKLWKDSVVERSLRVPLGIKQKKEIVYLDVHEKADGPHGLVAGTTGSGKSELLQSYLISLAIHFSPEDVGFLIIDFKGAELAKQLGALPHLLGDISSLEGHAVQRSLRFIRAEILKRQLLLDRYDKKSLDEYIQLRKNKDSSLPILPHLVIVVDEFSELKAQQPEFMDELKSAARIGRSLGIHLILATQKPAGVVDGQIWSNSRFKLCLKVQSKEDSNEVIHSPLSAEIREPGRAYLQVGNNEVFELFQSAYSGAIAGANRYEQVFRLNEVGIWGKRNCIYSSAHERTQAMDVSEPKTELNEIVEMLSRYCTEAHITRPYSICLPPLADHMYYEELSPIQCEQHSIMCHIGKVDDPDHQCQDTLSIDLNNGNLFILGASQSGKTTLLETMMYSITSSYTAQEVNVYVMDFSNGIPKLFEYSPIIGGICYREEEEKIGNLIAKLERECNKRRKLFAAHGVGNYKAYMASSSIPVPVITVIVDNVVAFKELYENEYERLISLFADAPGLGIVFVVSSAQSSIFYLRTMISFSQRISLYCNDSSEYINLFDRCNIKPENTAGRGIVKLGKELYEFQTALPVTGTSEKEMLDSLVDYFANKRKAALHFADAIPMIPETLLLDKLSNDLDEAFPYQVSIGLAYNGAIEQRIDLLQNPIISVLGREKSGRTNILRVLLHSLESRKEKASSAIYIADGQRRSLFSERNLGIVHDYSSEASEAIKMLVIIKQELEERQELIINANGDETLLHTFPLLVLVIGGKSMLNALLEHTEAVKHLKRIMELSRYKALILVDEMPNLSYISSSQEILLAIKNAKTGIITDDLENIMLFDVPVQMKKRFRKPMRVGDAYLMLKGQLVDKVRMAYIPNS